MEEFVKSLEHFITRDALYIIGGAIVLLSLGLILDFDFSKEPPSYPILVVVGVAYIVGYTIQDTLSLIGIVSTAYVVSPGRCARFWYRRLVGVQWKSFELPDLYEVEVAVHEKANHRDFSALQRLITLKQLGSTIGSCSLIGAVLIFIKSLMLHSGYLLLLSATLLILGLVLSLISRIKAAQQLALAVEISKKRPSRPDKPA